MRRKYLENNEDSDIDPAISFSDFSHTKYESPKIQLVKRPSENVEKDKRIRVSRPDNPPQIKVSEEVESPSTIKLEPHYSTLPTPTTSSSTVHPFKRGRKRLRMRPRYNNSTSLQTPDGSDSMIQYSYMTPDEAVNQMRRPYVSKSPTIQNSEYSSSTNYYYEPILTKEIQDSGKTMEKTQNTQSDFDNKFKYGHKTKLKDDHDMDAYFITHPTPNPVATTSTRKPFRAHQEIRSGHVRSSLNHHNTYRPNTSDSNKNFVRMTTRPQTNIKANVHSDMGMGAGKEEPDPQTTKVYRIRAKPHQKMRIIIKTTPRPMKTSSHNNMEDLAEGAESQIVSSVKLPPNFKQNSFSKTRHHTPKFELNDYEKTRVPVYYNVDLSDVNTTVIPPFNRWESSTLSSNLISTKPDVTKNNTKYWEELDRRHMLTYSPDDAIDEEATSRPNQDLKNREKDLEGAESGKNQYVVLYHIEDGAPKKKRPKPSPKPSHVTQQIHYHHHGGGGENHEKKYNTGGSYTSNGGYQTSKKNKYEEVEDDDGPDVTHTHHEVIFYSNTFLSQ